MFSDLLSSVQKLNREWGAESNGKLPHLFIPSKTATLVPEFVIEDLPSGRTAALVPEFGQNTLIMMNLLYRYYYYHDDDDDDDYYYYYYY